jgi:hypothetical protein
MQEQRARCGSTRTDEEPPLALGGGWALQVDVRATFGDDCRAIVYPPTGRLAD